MDAVLYIGGLLGTIFTGTVVLAIGQIVTRCMIEPALKMREVMAEIKVFLVVHANVLNNPEIFAGKPELSEARKSLRVLAGRLQSATEGVYGYHCLYRIKLVPAKEVVAGIVPLLIYFSNVTAPSVPGELSSEWQKLQDLLTRLKLPGSQLEKVRR